VRAWVLAAGALLLGATTPAAAQTTAPLGKAHLAGTFQLAGRVTVAVNIRGERAGQTATRYWSFKSLCTTGQCRVVVLHRDRAHGTDKVVLFRKGPAYYRGTGSFYAPLRCGGRVYNRGAKVPFTIKVWITTAQLDPSGNDVAVRVNATYTNRRRINMTSCVAFLGHDAARYHGHVVPT